MADICHQKLSDCSNHGRCLLNITSNTSYCQCDTCYSGLICKHLQFRQDKVDTTYLYLIVFSIGLGLSLLNNILGLEVFLGCRRIRRTNCGIYMIFYCILSPLSSILLVVHNVVEYYQNPFFINLNSDGWFRCTVAKVGYNTLVYSCIWLSACLAFERSIIVCFDSRTNATRWRSFGTLILVFLIAAGSATPMIVYKCDSDRVPYLDTLRVVFTFFYIIGGVLIYLVATILILISFARRIRRYGTESGSFIKTFLRLLYTHLFIFVPPAAHGLCYLPYSIAYSKGVPDSGYYQCGISTAEFVVKVAAESLQGAPIVLTWLLFIYPSRVYITEFYMNTWSGQRLAKILIFFKRLPMREATPARTIARARDDEPGATELKSVDS